MPAFIQRSDPEYSSSAAAPTLTGVTAGNDLIVVLSQISSASRTWVVTSDVGAIGGNTVLEQVVHVNPARAAGVFILRNVVAGDHTVTTTPSSGCQHHVTLIEVSGLDPLADPIVGSYVDPMNSGSHIHADPGIDVSGPAFIVGVAAMSATLGTVTPDPSADERWPGNTAMNSSQAQFHRRETTDAISGYQMPWSHTGSGRVATSVLVAFPLAAAGGGTTYDEAIEIACAHGYTFGRTLSMTASIALTADASVSDASAAAAMTAATTLSAVASFMPTVTASVLSAVSLDASTGLTPAVVASMAAQVAIGASAALTPAATLVAQATALVSAAAGLQISPSGQSYDASIALDAQAALVASSMRSMLASVGLDASASLTPVGALTAAASVAFDVEAAITQAATQLHSTAVALEAGTGVQAASSAHYQRALTLSIAAVLSAAGSLGSTPTYTVLRVVGDSLRMSAATGDSLRQVVAATESLRTSGATHEELD